MNPSIRPFTINVPQQEIDDLKTRLALSRFPPEKSAGWEKGVPVNYLQKVANYWQTGFDWKKQEAYLNNFPQYMAEIHGQPVHFVHIKSPDANAIPLLMIHGYPSSFVEFLQLAEMLTAPEAHGMAADPSYNLIIPSVPGFGFSIPSHHENWDLIKIAALFADLMTALGYERFAVHGTDMGAGIAGMLSGVAAHRLIGTHINTDFTSITGMGMLPADTSAFSEEEKETIAGFRNYEKNETAYLKILSTKPQTLAYGLTDSAAALLSWIIEKFNTWTNASKTLPEEAIALDLILTNISLYWFNKLGASSANTLYDAMNMSFQWTAQPPDEQSWLPPKVPSAVAAFGGNGELLKKLIGPVSNSDKWSAYDEALHFPAMECPLVLAKDLHSFLGSIAGK